jgi:signal transduction histidine kinase
VKPQRANPGIPSAGKAVWQFVLVGLAALAISVGGSLLVLRELGKREATRDARELAVLVGQGIVESNIDDRLVRGNSAAVARIDRVVQERVLGERIARVKIWTRQGRIVYSDEPRLIGATYPLAADALETLKTGAAHVELSDLSRPENRFERGQGRLYEVYARVRTPAGTALLFETYQRSSSLVSTGRDIWLPFAVPLLASLVLLWLVQVAFGWRLARRLQRSRVERELLLIKAVQASGRERARIAADLHDGVVQDLAGLSYSLSASADAAPAPSLAETLREDAGRVRGAIRQLRTLLVEIHPPNLSSAGLAAALRDLLGPLTARGVETSLEVPEELDVSTETEQLLFRAAAEAVRNVQRHAGASAVTVRVETDGELVRLEIVDDGAGFDPEVQERRRSEGHVGLSLLEELAASRGGSLVLRTAPGEGTSFVFEVPRK